jgi:hypothetical protein
MNLTLKHVVAAIVLVLGFAAPAAAGPLEDADAAISRRDYATAVRLVRPLAEQAMPTLSTISGSFTTTALVSLRIRSAHTRG